MALQYSPGTAQQVSEVSATCSHVLNFADLAGSILETRCVR